MPDVFTTHPSLYEVDPQITDDGKVDGYVVEPEDWLEILGALRRLNRALYQREFNVRQYGAVGDGSTDDTAAIQAAFDAAGAVQGKVVFGPGSWRTTSTILFDSNIAIEGVGGQASTIAFEGASGFALAPRSTGVRMFNLHVSRLQIDVAMTTADGGIDITDMSIAFFDTVTIIGAGIGHGIGIRVAGTSNGFAVYNAFFHTRCSSFNYGWSIEPTGSNDTHIIDCRPVACERGISIVNGNHTVVMSCCIESNTRGVYVESTSSALCDGLTIIGNRFESNTTSNIAVGGTPSFVRSPLLEPNQHVTGTPYENVLSLTGTGVSQVRVMPGGGTQGGQLWIESTVAAASGPSFVWIATQASTDAAYFRQGNTGSGSPFVVRASGGRAASHAFSACSWNGSVDTENAYVTAAGAMLVQSASIVGNLDFTGAASTLALGLAATAGNAQVQFRKGAANNQSIEVCRSGATGTSSAENVYLRQHDSSRNHNWLVYDNSGNLLSIPIIRFRYVGINGRTQVEIPRLRCTGATAVQASDFALSAGWGTGASVSAVLAGSTSQAGQITISIGTGTGANPTITFTDPNGAWTTSPIGILMRNGGTETGTTGMTIADSTAGFVVTMIGTPTASGTIIIRWIRM